MSGKKSRRIAEPSIPIDFDQEKQITKLVEDKFGKKFSDINLTIKFITVLFLTGLVIVFAVSIGILIVSEDKRNQLLLIVKNNNVYLNTSGTVSTTTGESVTTTGQTTLTEDYKFNVSYFTTTTNYKPIRLRIEFDPLEKGAYDLLKLKWTVNEDKYISYYNVYTSDESITNLTVVTKTSVASPCFNFRSNRNAGKKYFSVESILMDSTSSGLSSEFVYDGTLRFMAYGNPLGDLSSDEDIFMFDGIAIADSNGATKRTVETTAYKAAITYGTDYKFSSNGQYIAWISDNLDEETSRFALMVANTSGDTTSYPINYDLLVNSSSQTFAFGFSRDCTKIYFICNCTRNFPQLYVSDINGSNAVEISRPSGASFSGVIYSPTNRLSPQFTEDGRILWIERSQGVDNLLMRNINLTNSVIQMDDIVNGTMPSGTLINGFKLTPDGRHVLFSANHDSINRYDLYKIFLGNPQQVAKMSPSRSISSIDSINLPFFITPDSQFVVYSFVTTTEYRTYHSTPVSLDGSYSVVITQTPVLGFSFPVNIYDVISPSGDMFAFGVVNSTSCEIYIGSVRGSYDPWMVSAGESVTGCTISSFRWSRAEQGRYIVLHSKYDLTYPMLYVIDTLLKTTTRISTNTLGHANAKDYIITDDGRNVIYIADERSNGRNEVFINSIPPSTTSKLVGAVGSLTRDYTTLVGNTISGLHYRFDA